MKILISALIFTIAGLLWMRHENSTLGASFERVNRLASEQRVTIDSLQKQLRSVSEFADNNARAQAELRRRLDTASERAVQREQTIKRLLYENDAFRRWYGADLPDAVRRLHQRVACVSAADCLSRMSKSHPLPDAGQRSEN